MKKKSRQSWAANWITLSLSIACLGLAAFPWALSVVFPPLPVPLRETSTALAAIRTARITGDTISTPLPLDNALPTITITLSPHPTMTFTPSSTPTPSPTPTITASPTLTPTPRARGLTIETVNTYTCPATQYMSDTLTTGSDFFILGWNETIEEGVQITWLLIEDEIGVPQKWIKESQYIQFSPAYKSQTSRIACRQSP